VLAVAALTVAGATAATACAEGSTTVPSGEAASGEALYLTACASCHGTDGAGQPGIADPIPAGITELEVRSVIRNGVGAMEGFPDLPAAQVEAIAEYVTTDLRP
jgi:mono/diheme cytochrome c family protein